MTFTVILKVAIVLACVKPILRGTSSVTARAILLALLALILAP